MTENAQIMELLKKTAAALEKNNMQTFVVSTREEAKETVKKLMPEGSSVTMGGSQTIKQCGIYDMLKCGGYEFYDRSAPDVVTEEQKLEIYRKAFLCNTYLSSSNAITQNGELYNVDGNSNRVAAMLYGSDQLIVVAGYNKIVADIDEAILRLKTKAAPPNCERLSLDTYCRNEGRCVSLTKENPTMCDGCNSESRICCNYVVMARQRNKQRVKVILVAEELGY